MDTLVGKTSARVADEPDERVLFFTDGSSVSVTGEDYLRVEIRSAEETRRHALV